MVKVAAGDRFLIGVTEVTPAARAWTHACLPGPTPTASRARSETIATREPAVLLRRARYAAAATVVLPAILVGLAWAFRSSRRASAAATRRGSIRSSSSRSRSSGPSASGTLRAPSWELCARPPPPCSSTSGCTSCSAAFRDTGARRTPAEPRARASGQAGQRPARPGSPISPSCWCFSSSPGGCSGLRSCSSRRWRRATWRSPASSRNGPSRPSAFCASSPSRSRWSWPTRTSRAPFGSSRGSRSSSGSCSPRLVFVPLEHHRRLLDDVPPRLRLGDRIRLGRSSAT